MIVFQRVYLLVCTNIKRSHTSLGKEALYSDVGRDCFWVFVIMIYDKQYTLTRQKLADMQLWKRNQKCFKLSNFSYMAIKLPRVFVLGFSFLKIIFFFLKVIFPCLGCTEKAPKFPQHKVNTDCSLKIIQKVIIQGRNKAEDSNSVS